LASQPLLREGCRAEARRAQADRQGKSPSPNRKIPMFYVYILQSVADLERFYAGVTEDLKSRFKEHNAGDVFHTSKYKPWRIKNYFAFDDRKKAYAFEKYLKTGSGRAFAKRHF